MSLVDAKQLVGVAAQTGADGRDSVALVDGKRDDRFEPRILAEQSDVRAVQGGDHREVPPFLGEDALGHVGAGGMWEWRSAHAAGPGFVGGRPLPFWRRVPARRAGSQTAGTGKF